MRTVDHLADPFRFCEENCTHDLARGVSARELLQRDGPHPAAAAVIGRDPTRRPLLPGRDIPDAA